jgi:quinol monooxygenase YgiN
VTPGLGDPGARGGVKPHPTQTRIRLEGRLVCVDAAEAARVAAHLPEDIRLSQAEPGCVAFEVMPTDDPLVWSVRETFTDRAGFDAHQSRTKASDWARETAGIKRIYEIFGP